MGIFEGNDECDADQSSNIFEQELEATGFADEVVCDADPCHIAVFEVYGDLDDSTNSTANGTESSSAESAECDESGSPGITAFIIDECQPMDSATIIISCTGTHDASVEYYPNDDCSGSANVTTTTEEFFGEFCATMVACNVEAGEDWDDSAHAVAIFAPLLIAFVALLNA